MPGKRHHIANAILCSLVFIAMLFLVLVGAPATGREYPPLLLLMPPCIPLMPPCIPLVLAVISVIAAVKNRPVTETSLLKLGCFLILSCTLFAGIGHVATMRLCLILSALPISMYFVVRLNREEAAPVSPAALPEQGDDCDEYCTELVEVVQTARFGSLHVYKAGLRKKDNITKAYAEACVKDLDALPQEQFLKLNRWLCDLYDMSVNILDPDEFQAKSLYVFEPDESGVPACVVSGDASFEEEHGISFSVLDGEIVDCSYAYDFDNPFSKKQAEKHADPGTDGKEE